MTLPFLSSVLIDLIFGLPPESNKPNETKTKKKHGGGFGNSDTGE